LYLARNEITTKGAKAIYSALIINKVFTLLILTTGEPRKCYLFDPVIENGLSYFDYELEFEEYSLPNIIEDEDPIVIGETLKTNTILEELHLDKFETENEDGKAIGDALKVNKTLRELSLNHNMIMDKGAIIIGGALKSNKTLIESSMVKNRIEDKGAEAIGEALKFNTTLQVINLSFNRINKGAISIEEALRINRSLTE